MTISHIFYGLEQLLRDYYLWIYLNFRLFQMKNICNMNQTVDIKELNERIRQESSFVDLLTIEMNKVIVGQKHLVESLLTALLADGHILLEGVPVWPRPL